MKELFNKKYNTEGDKLERHKELILIENLIEEIRQKVKLLESELKALERMGIDYHDPEFQEVIRKLESLSDYLNILIERRIYIEGKYK